MKRSFVSVLFVLLSAGGVLSTPLSVKLDLNVRDEEHFKIESAQLDNVYYTHYTPKWDQFVSRVYQSNVKIWESSGYARLVYALTAHGKNAPSLLYIKVDKGYSAEYKYYKNQSSRWVEIDLCEYEKSVAELARAVKLEEMFTLNVFQPVNDKYYTIQFSTKERPYTYITPRVGYVARSVKYLKETLWKAQKYGDRCVAVWAYLNNATYYMVRLLVTRHNDESEILTFVLKNQGWEMVDLMDKTHTNKYAQKPENFIYPNYKFSFAGSTPEALEEDNPEESALDVPRESYFDVTGDYYKFNVQDGDDAEEGEAPVSERVNSKEVDKRELATEISETEVLHLSDPTTRRVRVDLRHVDNVLYKIYRIGRFNAPAKVVDTSGTVWAARTKAERCVYLMSAQSHGSAYALYMVIEVGGEMTSAYFLRVKEKWVKTNLEHYKQVVEHLKKNARKTKMAIDIANKVQNVNATVVYNNEKSPNYMFLPRKGYECIRVENNKETIWQAVGEERCVALWSYECFGKPYYVRMVTTDAYGMSDLISLLNADGKWELLTSYNVAAVNHLRITGPSNFFNPEYDFNRLPEYGARPLADIIKETTSGAEERKSVERKSECSFKGVKDRLKKIESEDSVTYAVTTVKEEENTETRVEAVAEAKETTVGNKKELTLPGYRPALRTFDPNRLLTIDLAPEGTKITDRIYSVFDNKIKLVGYHAPPGYYFDLVTHGTTQLFWGTVDTTLCYAVNLYLKGEHYYLCDLLLRNREHDMTVYFRLEDYVWVAVPKKEYMLSLEELSSTKAP
ncbi:uncharacterized protein TOT_040000486 [Theileria orientalis strain Shintoku]|uniref:Uncharacterized protein n=1 Tax=Theileria orientalis strain Shintoku TaxID=869250 RepID=J4C988_THEOR|nr:uncharacterized protein TOT_040000486 [Theileria orientalis strain Shintoku]BAM42113.1 uncharacterized protein TOT_040000486 [Theileria orientalis strain Shintoku]|eukprot:XP_009692414.1 uncharacterized protein TOT_040000486 [Theileria orientalis strain Shintoku]